MNRIDPTAQPQDRLLSVIGLACRFPGAPDAAAYWRLLRAGLTGFSTVPGDRWDHRRYAGMVGQVHSSYAHIGGFLDEVDGFDAPCFGMTQAEAEGIDPQQRVLIEVGWSALQNAGIAPDALRGKKVGTFVGATNVDYHRWVYGDVGRIDARAAPGSSLGSGANRLSYLLDLRGPSLTIDTGCSSALVALHYARQSLLCGECELAIVAGVNLMLLPGNTISHCQTRSLSTSNSNRAFGADADGYVRGEGCGAIVVTRNSSPWAKRRRIWGTIVGTAVNQSGRTNGFGAPNGPAQMQAIQGALEDAGIAFADVDYIECHGSSTVLGDAIELATLGSLAGNRLANGLQPCWVGSVKNNIGHLEAAAGIAGLIKLLLAQRHGELPPHVLPGAENRQLTRLAGRLRVPAEAVDWTEREAPRRYAGVSAFSFGGTNCHVLTAGAVPTATGAGKLPLPAALELSAPDLDRLRLWAQCCREWLDENPDVALSDFCASLNALQSLGGMRALWVAGSADGLREQLAAFERGEDIERVTVEPGSVRLPVRLRLTGAGIPAWRSLAEHLPPLLRRVSSLRLALKTRGEMPAKLKLRQSLFSLIDDFVVELAVGEWLQTWLGPIEDFVGEGVGQLAALCLSGRLKPEAVIDGLHEAAGQLECIGPAEVDRWVAEQVRSGAASTCVLEHGPRQRVLPAPPAWLADRPRRQVMLAAADALADTTVLLRSRPGADPAAGAWADFVMAATELVRVGAFGALRQVWPIELCRPVEVPAYPFLRTRCRAFAGSFDEPEGGSPVPPAAETSMPGELQPAAGLPEAAAADEGLLPELSDLPDAPLPAWIANWVGARLGGPVPEAQYVKPMSELGMESKDFVALAEALTARLGQRVEPIVFWSHSTIAGLAAHLASQAPPDAVAAQQAGAAPDGTPRQPDTLAAGRLLSAKQIDDMDEAEAEALLSRLV